MSALHRWTLASALLLATAVAGQASAQERDAHAGHGQHAGHEEHRETARGGTHAAHAGHAAHGRHAVDREREDDKGHAEHSGHAHAGHAAHGAATGHDRPLAPIPALTDADRAAAFPPLAHHGMQHAPELNGHLLFDRLEAWDDDHGSGQAWEVQGWLGGDTDRLWLRSEGERHAGATEAASVELLYGRSVSPWWDVVAGVRHDFPPGGSQDWLAVGVQGLAPYLFEVSATGYLGESGRSMLGVEAEYDLLLSNRLILQPTLEATAHGKADPSRGVGAGLSTVEAGLRLRYEAHRRFAPYLGVVHERSFGETTALRRAAGGQGRETRVVAGIRFWF